MSKPLPILSHMPWNVNHLITSSTDTVTKQSLRLCSRNFEKLVRNSEISYEKLALRINTENRTASVILESVPGNTVELKYTSTPNGYTVKNKATNEEKAVENASLIHGAIDQFVKIFRNPKTFVKRFDINFKDIYADVDQFKETKREVIERIRAFFVSLNSQVTIRGLGFRFNGDQEDVLQLLQFFKPGILQKFVFLSIYPRHQLLPSLEVDLSRIAETEQWKQAWNLYMDEFKMSLAYEKWSNFSKSSFFESTWTVAESIALSKNFFNDPSFKNCEICYKYDTFDPKSFLEHFLKFDPEITGKTGVNARITLKIDIPSHPDMWFIVRIRWFGVILSKVRKDEGKDKKDLENVRKDVNDVEEANGEVEQLPQESRRKPVKLTAAQALADINKYTRF